LPKQLRKTLKESINLQRQDLKGKSETMEPKATKKKDGL
jgi:hypothetical protein